ncbi:MAG: type II toxin-antitoxin system RelE/ParE family toxin [Pirellulales bacterium]|nr:type II toxin-antitoxin system RelE/ParE family toxin [Pirellulales bacterium]
MAAIRWTAEASRWMRTIRNHIAKDSPVAADRTMDGIYAKVQFLGKFPRLGYRYEPVKDREVRIVLYGHYRIAYVIRTNGAISVLGVFHASMQIEEYLK